MNVRQQNSEVESKQDEFYEGLKWWPWYYLQSIAQEEHAKRRQTGIPNNRTEHDAEVYRNREKRIPLNKVLEIFVNTDPDVWNNSISIDKCKWENCLQ